MEKILINLEKKLKIKVKHIEKYHDGTTNALVFCVNNTYLIKKMSRKELNTQILFFDFYKDNNYFQKIVYVNKRLCFICFRYLNGILFNKNKQINKLKIIDEIYSIVKSYKKVNNNFYGYLEYPKISAIDFLKSEIEYAKEKLKKLNIDDSKVYIALNKFKNIKIDKYLLHGDFGVHNFLINNKYLRVIDPMPLVFDPLYDFYFAILSSNLLFVDLSYIFKYFNHDLNYKKNLLLIVFYIRMSRAYLYDVDHFKDYLRIYETL